MRREMSRTRHARMRPQMMPPPVQRNVCCSVSRLRHGRRAASNCSLVIAGLELVDSAFTRFGGAKVAIFFTQPFSDLSITRLLPLHFFSLASPYDVRDDQ